MLSWCAWRNSLKYVFAGQGLGKTYVIGQLMTQDLGERYVDGHLGMSTECEDIYALCKCPPEGT